MGIQNKMHWHVVSPASWPAPPAEMSVSTYTEIADCPRRWALSSAQYPELWSGRGYPPKLQVEALAGGVVHLVLETITKQLVRAGVPSVTDPKAPQVLRELGGYTKVVEECVERILNHYTDNPRAGAVMEYARLKLRGKVPELRMRIQSMLNRLQLRNNASTSTMEPTQRPNPKPSGSFRRRPLVRGTHSEIEIRAKNIGWKGRVDLLIIEEGGCKIIDFKTGAADEAHKFQLRAYATMWYLDEELNPSRRLADSLVLAYQAQNLDVPSLSALEIEAMSSELLAHRLAAEEALTMRPPLAITSSKWCRYCGVRQLCEQYWSSTELAVSDDERRIDIELKIVGRHGPRSWDAVVTRAKNLPENAPALLRPQRIEEFEIGSTMRVLDCLISRNEEDESAATILTLNAMSEIYEVL